MARIEFLSPQAGGAVDDRVYFRLGGVPAKDVIGRLAVCDHTDGSAGEQLVRREFEHRLAMQPRLAVRSETYQSTGRQETSSMVME
jgi:hypothetical protein